MPASPNCATASLESVLVDCGVLYNSCPTPVLISAREVGTANRHFFVRPCGRWSCEQCCKVKSWTLGLKVKLAHPNKFLTLTCRRTDTQSAREAYDSSRRAVSELSKMVRRDHGEFEYVRVLENTKAGWPHYHLLVRSEFLPHSSLKSKWMRLTGNNILHVEAIRGTDHASKYITKYLTKFQPILYTSRRISWSRSFFPPKGAPPPKNETLVEWTIHSRRGLFSFAYELATHQHEQVNCSHWIVAMPEKLAWTTFVEEGDLASQETRLTEEALPW